MKCQISSRSFLPTAILAASLATGVAFAAPHDPRVNPGATSTPGTISLSRSGLPILGAYLFSVTNGTPANLNFVTVTATTDPKIGSTAVSAVIDQVINLADGVDPSCTPDPLTNVTTTVTCSPGTLAPGKKLNFVVVIKSPTAGGVTELNWKFTASEGNSTNGCCDESGTATTTLVDATTSESAKEHVQSFVKASTVSTLFTGNGGVATQSDPWTTTVQVPVFTFAKYVTADVTESVVDSSCSPVSTKCKRSAITIPTNLGDTFDSLLITFQQHPSIIKKGSKIENWVISYSKNPGDINFPFIPVQKCSLTATLGPVSGTPCIDSCKEYTRKSDPNSPELWGIFQCTARASDNGSWEN